jgi:Xaa-Pro aminopeptidase
MLDPQLSRGRQRRLLDVMTDQSLDAIVIGQPEHVYYFTAHRPHWLQHACLVLTRDGHAWLTTANKPDEKAAADTRLSYDAQWHATQRQEQPQVIAAQAADYIGGISANRVGCDTSLVSAHLVTAAHASLYPVDEALWQMRRRKDPDELALMRRAIDCTRAMYERARQMIEPGCQEIAVFNALHATAVETAGEALSALLGNDFTVGGGGGPPRNDRAARAGEIYILDLGPAIRGYFADNCRAFAVNRDPTDAQQRAFEAIAGVFPIVERMARPGASCRAIYEAASAHLEESYGQALKHHLGHGVGLQPHEFPHLNPRWDDVLLEGEVFTAEPGLYGAELAGGIRIENQYLVTGSGIQNLTPFPIELA